MIKINEWILTVHNKKVSNYAKNQAKISIVKK